MIEVPLTQGKFALIDDGDLDLVMKYKWSWGEVCQTSSYAQATRRGRRVYMHRIILGLQPGQRVHVDHINGNGLDNRRCNLRLATHAQNLANQKPRPGRLKGVSKMGNRWRAQIGHGGEKYYLGSFADRIEAALAYDLEAIRLFGPWARPNFLKA